MTNQLTLAQLNERRAANPRLTLVEALPEKYFRDWHLPGAIHVPHTEVRERAPELLADKSAEIVVYCASATCQNSHMAARTLVQMGYSNVAVFPGGKQDWSDAGLSQEREVCCSAT